MIMDYIKKLEECFEIELHYLAVGLHKEHDPRRRSNIAWYCVQRCLGATQFAEMCGADSGTVEAMFEAIKEKIAILEEGA
jgi:hypothetical protein